MKEIGISFLPRIARMTRMNAIGKILQKSSIRDIRAIRGNNKMNRYHQ